MRHSYFIQQLLPAIVMMFVGVTAANAYNFKVDSIYYAIISSASSNVSVTCEDDDDDNGKFNSYSGEVTIPESVTYNGTTYSVTAIGKNAFRDCDSLTCVNIPSSVTSINSHAFHNCDLLSSITIPDNITSIGEYAFYDCDLLSSITIPESVVDIATHIFDGCDTLTTVILGDSVTVIGAYAFNNCKKLDSIPLPNSLKIICESAFANCTSLPSITIPESVDSIGEKAFQSCSSLPSVTIPDSVKIIYSSTFESCSAMDSVNLGNGVTAIYASAFNSCSSLPSITFPESLDSIGESAFYGCSSLLSVIIPDGVTGIGASAFESCSSLKNLKLSSGISRILYNTFAYCSSLPSVTIPDKVKDIGESAFAYCSSLKSVTIPDNVTSIGESAFNECSSVTSVKIGSGLTEISKETFYKCTSLPNITIPDNVTSIGSSAFYGCSSLKSMILGSGITEIGTSAFRYCNALKSIYCMRDTPPSLSRNNSLNIDSIKNKAVVFVDGTAFQSYRTASYWKRFTRVAITRYMDEGEEINAGDTLNIYSTTDGNDATYAVVTFGSKNASGVWAAAEEEKTLDVVGPFSNYVKGKVAATNEDGGSYNPASEDNNTFDAPIAGAYLMMEPKADGTIYVAVKKQGDVYVCDETGTTVDYLMAELPNGVFKCYGSSSAETEEKTSESESASDTEETDSCIRYSFPALAGKTYFVTSTGGNCLSVAGYAFEPTDVDDPFAATELTISDSSEDNLTESSEITTGQYDVTLNRSFTKGGWTSMVLPFSVSPSMLNETFGDSTAIIYFNRVSNDTLYLTEHYHDMIVAGTPMFIRPDTTATSLTFKCVTYGEPTIEIANDTLGTYSVTSQTLPSIEENIIGCENNKSDWELKASYVSVQGEENDSTHYYMIGFKYETDTIMVADENGDSIEVAKVDSTVINNYFFEYNKVMNIKGLRAWLEDITENNSAARLITVSRNGIIDDDDTETTGIINALTGNSGTATATRRSNSGNGNIYNLHGQMVRHASEGTSGLPQGIYIVNGKKIIVE